MADQVGIVKKIETIAPGLLNPSAYNPRTISPQEFAKLRRSLREFGFVEPVVVNNGNKIIGGHQRVRAAIEEGLKRVPIVRLDLPETKAKALNLALNRISGEWDVPLLKDLLGQLSATPEFDVEITGFNAIEIEQLGSSDASAEKPERTSPQELLAKSEQLRKRWRTGRGQLWVIGGHKVFCGDSTQADHVRRVMGGRLADAIVTDPPFGLGRVGIANDSGPDLAKLYQEVLQMLPAENAIVIAFQSPRFFRVWLDAIKAAGHRFQRALWSYQVNRQSYPWRGWLMKSDMLLVSTLGTPSWPKAVPACHDTYSDRYEPEVESTGAWHPSVKLLSVVRSLVAHTRGLIFDPFLGAGTTVVAAHQLGRTCCGIEIDPRYVAITLQRMANLGLKPKLAK
ncbi:hypothetical protein LCGC14_2056100 [marine sediment metagenome]|uniref:ParB-like N-terminal domain-containing protein n=1 Tax=marine sediment metagenome TaxID=412755 RepID=A0A0F9FA38_9ZZZZ